MNQLENLTIGKVISHTINDFDPKKGSNSVSYTSQPIRLNAKIKKILVTRIVSVLGDDNTSGGVEMEIDPLENHDALEKCINITSAPTSKKFTNLSKEVCAYLAEAQNNRKATTGPVLVIKGTTTSKNLPCCIVIKAEYHQGFRKIKNKVKLLEDIFLSPHQKLYKVALVMAKNKNKSKVLDISNYQIFIHDNLKRNSAAKYFSSKFLGLKMLSTSKLLVEIFFKESIRFVNNSELTEGKKFDLIDHLYSYMLAPGIKKISTADFSKKYITDPKVKDSFRKALKKKGLPSGQIEKDISNLRNELKRRSLEFSENERVTYPSGMSRKINIKSHKKTTVITIKDHIKKQQ